MFHDQRRSSASSVSASISTRVTSEPTPQFCLLDLYGYLPYIQVQKPAVLEVIMPRTDTAGKRPRSERLEARVSRERKELFFRAATLQGRSLTDFLVASVQEAAIETVRTHDALRLSERDRQAFVSALLAPTAPTQTLERAAKRYRERTGL